VSTKQEAKFSTALSTFATHTLGYDDLNRNIVRVAPVDDRQSAADEENRRGTLGF